ncbi:MAG: hypothetical protein M3Q00_03960 [Pseudomonadota bacterium]|nr:hypothetical protein [Pseudomonadota bacterium]
MLVTYHRIEALPKLSWLGVVDISRATLRVYHGHAVETHQHFYVEGCWDGSFQEGALDESECVNGTGARIRDDSVTFVPPSNTLDSLFYLQIDVTVVASNSLPFLLAFCNDSLNPNFDGYDRVFDSIAKGINHYDRRIKTICGHVNRLLYRNLKVSAIGCEFLDKRRPPPFQGFRDYVEYMEQTYAKLVANIRDPARRVAMQVFSTQSSGYDTTAVNSIAAKHGIDKVFTCTTARDKFAFVGRERDMKSDDGSEIGKALGFDCIPIDRLAYQKTGLPDEVLYFAGAYHIADVNLLEINGHVTGAAMLLNGTLGEIWRGKEYYEPHRTHWTNDELIRCDLSQHGMGEVRLQAGIVSLPFPFIGARSRPDIYRIACSAEMNHWRVGGGYDKAIARRIAEERGVPRDLFGQTKLNTTVGFARPPIPYNPELKREYFEYLVRNNLVAWWQLRLLPLIHRLNQAIHYSSPRNYKAIYYFGRVVSKLLHRHYEPAILLQRLSGSVYCFCVNKVSNDYSRKCSFGPASESNRESSRHRQTNDVIH